MKKIIGVDIDGVLADFNTPFIDLVIKNTGRDLFPPRPFEIPCWQYPNFYGYTKEEESRVWKVIEHDDTFWQRLPEYPDTRDSIAYLRSRMENGDDVYFVTSRPGLSAKAQTQRWLRRRLIDPTVLISSQKGMCATALGMDVYIDDRWENAVNVSYSKTRSILFNRPWNRVYNAEAFGIARTSTVVGFVDLPAPVAAANP